MTRTLDVLWLEDDEDFAFAAQQLLRLGADEPLPDGTRVTPSVRRVSSVAEAMDELTTVGVPDLIVADLNVQDSMGGKTILSLREAAPDVPLLVLSGIKDLEPQLVVAMENAEFLSKEYLSAERLWNRVCMAMTRLGTAGTAATDPVTAHAARTRTGARDRD